MKYVDIQVYPKSILKILAGVSIAKEEEGTGLENWPPVKIIAISWNEVLNSIQNETIIF